MMLEAEQNSNCLLEIFSSAALEKLLKHTNISLEYLREGEGERNARLFIEISEFVLKIRPECLRIGCEDDDGPGLDL